MSYLFTGGPVMLSGGLRKRRQMMATNGLFGLANLGVNRDAQFATREANAQATEAGLEARLGGAEDSALTSAANYPTQSSGMSALSAGMLGPTPPASGSPASASDAVGGSSDQSAISEVPADTPGSLGAADSARLNRKRIGDADASEGESTLGYLARRGVNAIFGANYPNTARTVNLGRLTGMAKAREDRLKQLWYSRPYLGQSADPGAVERAIVAGRPVPSTALRPRTVNPTLLTLALQAHPGDINAAIDDYTRREAAINAGKAVPPVSETRDQSTVNTNTGQPVGPLDFDQPTTKRTTVTRTRGGAPPPVAGSAGFDPNSLIFR